ncbi:hypothetical protein ANCDUO_07608 [Ancylostoma duodenale]|uniref:Transporter n=1 Tax=Ancylostoma duodenale TaxID=51022 RepID=A0A0C2CYJ1_9BILA|nr:hypothetical protein ANCDUO_07608 [Ancylostoma duodenale]
MGKQNRNTLRENYGNLRGPDGQQLVFDTLTELTDKDVHVGADIMVAQRKLANHHTVTFHDDEHAQKREQWDNKTQFYMGVISYAVGLGNVWRFPYLCQKNGGGAFLIPYVIMMILLGLPLFLIELGIGQRLRTGPMGVWNAIHPYLGEKVRVFWIITS